MERFYGFDLGDAESAIALARRSAGANEPEILLMDEPSASLDPRNRRNLIHVLCSLPYTKLITCHDLDFILDTCNRVILLADGSIAADGPAEELLRDQALLEQNRMELPLSLAGR